MIKLKEATKPVFKLYKISNFVGIIGAVYAKDEKEAGVLAKKHFELKSDKHYLAKEWDSQDRQKTIRDMKWLVHNLENPIKP